MPAGAGLTTNPTRWRVIAGYALAILSQVALTCMLSILTPVLPLSDFPIPYLLIAVWIAYAFDLGPAIVCAFVGWLAYDFFFVPPVYTIWPLAIERQGWAQQVAFVVGATAMIATSIQVGRSRRRVQQLADEATALNLTLREEIAERERADVLLREHAAALQEQAHMLDLAHIIIRDLDGKIVFWNRGTESLYGWTKEEALGTTTDELFHTVFPRPLEEIEAQVLTVGEWQGELVHTRRDGSKIVLASHWVLHRDENGDPNAFIEVNNDITELKQAEERYRNLFMSMNEAFLLCEVILDQDGNPQNWRYLEINPAFEANTGVRAEDAIGKTVKEVFPGIEPYWIDAFGQVALTGEPMRLEHYNRDLDRYFVASAYRPYPGRFAMLFNDVTDRVRAEQAARESMEQFQTLANAMPQLAWMAEADGYIFWFNEGVYDYTGATPEQMIGWGWQRMHDPSALPHVLRKWRMSLQTGDPFEMEFPLRRADGQFRWFLTRIRPMRDSDGRVVRWFGTATDISDKREAEERIGSLNAELEERVIQRTQQLDAALQQERAARADADAAKARTKSWLELAPDGIIIVNKEGDIEFANNRAAQMFGYESDELLRESIEILVPERYREAHVSQRLEYMANPRTRSVGSGLDLYGIRKDGSEFPVEIALSPTRTDGELTVTAIVRDITERKQAEREIQRLNEGLSKRALQLEVSNRELEAFSYSVSHDLRAPLRAIDGFSNALLKHYLSSLDDRGQDYLQRVRAAAQRMGQLIDDILGLSRASRVEMRRDDVDLSAMSAEILSELQKSQPERKAEIAIMSGMVVNADSHLLRIAMDNLLGNAWKFSGMREVTRIEVGAFERDAERVYFVKDNGAGFNPEYADKLFSPFQRLHAESQFPGTGIGLALVQRIIRRHGGRIWAESAVDQGATFFFTLEEAQS